MRNIYRSLLLVIARSTQQERHPTAESGSVSSWTIAVAETFAVQQIRERNHERQSETLGR
jgi:hypothetical protein